MPEPDQKLTREFFEAMSNLEILKVFQAQCINLGVAMIGQACHPKMVYQKRVNTIKSIINERMITNTAD
ncbi:hypothetical protein ACFLZ9_01030 [Patescibacteria group bacterium]